MPNSNVSNENEATQTSKNKLLSQLEKLQRDYYQVA